MFMRKRKNLFIERVGSVEGSFYLLAEEVENERKTFSRHRLLLDRGNVHMVVVSGHDCARGDIIFNNPIVRVKLAWKTILATSGTLRNSFNAIVR